ncbi:MAG: deoxyribodipyrimidine photo-lyase, partial [Acidimicrobiales bacterium]
MAVIWFRRDLRVADHGAMTVALSGLDRVVPLFVWDPVLTRSSGPNCLCFLAGCVEALDRSLGSHLVVRSGDPERMVAEAATEDRARAVHATADFGPYGGQRDSRVVARLSPDCEL